MKKFINKICTSKNQETSYRNSVQTFTKLIVIELTEDKQKTNLSPFTIEKILSTKMSLKSVKKQKQHSTYRSEQKK